MRLKPEKIDRLAELIHAALASNEQIKIPGEKETVIRAVAQVIAEDMREEEDIEREARDLLEQHAEELQRSGMRSDQALMKTKKRIAQQRKFVL